MPNSKEYYKQYRAKNRLKIREQQRNWYLANKNKAKLAWDKYTASGKEKETRQKRTSTLEYRQSALKRANDYKNKNPDRYRVNQRNYQTTRRRLGGKFNRLMCLQVYKECPPDKEVDHIIPLKHDKVCGLHVPWNMQYLTRQENAKKGNSFDFTYENTGWNNSSRS